MEAGTPLTIGISPHAPYTVEGPALRKVVSRAIARNAPITMHLAELAEETDFLRDLSGPLGREWDLMLKMDIIDDEIPLFPYGSHGSGGPVRWAQRWGLIVTDKHHKDPPPRRLPVLLAHVNYCDDAELAQLAASPVSIAYCPRTHAYFRHAPHRYRDMLAAGINVCLATDSRASNPDLSILKEAQLVHQRDELDPYTALELITTSAARALGLGNSVGSLSPEKHADLLFFPMADGDPDALLANLVNTAPAPAKVWIGGTPVNFSDL
jgi:cytosine/adenosine deaminase-related metal-dependent hydrolase